MMRQHSSQRVSVFLIVFTISIFLLFNNFYIYKDGGNSENLDVLSVPMVHVMAGEPIILPQNDYRIIKYIWDNDLIEAPSTGAYNLRNSEENPSKGQGQFIQKILRNMTNGFFVEAGALDGETRSNTLFLEQHLGWKGLLVEGDPSNYALVKKKNRKAWISNTCLAIKPYPHLANFVQQFNIGKIVDSKAMRRNGKKVVTVQCMPLFSLLSALNVTTVDYFSLDVEGSDLKVLKTIPFDKVFIKTLSVEFIHTTEGKDSLLKFMESKGYIMLQEIRASNNLANDFMFLHGSVQLKT